MRWLFGPKSPRSEAVFPEMEAPLLIPAVARGDFSFADEIPRSYRIDAIFSPSTSGLAFSRISRMVVCSSSNENGTTLVDLECRAFDSGIIVAPIACRRASFDALTSIGVLHYSTDDLELLGGCAVALDLSFGSLKCRGHIFQPFVSIKLSERSKKSLNPPAPGDNPLSELFFVLLASKNWDLRIQGLNALLRAYPPSKAPFHYQEEGIAFLAERKAALLADEMGLGKTIQAILAMRALVHTGKVSRALVLCPKSLIPTWTQEISEWAPELSLTIAHGPNKQAALQRPHHVYVTNYESLSSFQYYLSAHQFRNFDLLIVDEIQNLKNPNTQRARAATEINAACRWGLTGTPLENRLGDYYAIWNVLVPDSLALWDSMVERETQTRNRVLRREKSAVLKDLPSKALRVVFIELDDKQRRQYDAIESLMRDQVEESISNNASDNELRMNVLSAITKLKQLCVFDMGSGQSAKMDWIQELLDEMHPKDASPPDCEKALVFTQYPKKVWEEWKLQNRLEKFSPLRFDGSLSGSARQEVVRKFQEEERHRLAFMSLKAGGTGLTLTRANHVVFLDQWWDPAVMDQAAARIHRIGQGRNCVVTTLIAKDTIDERIETLLNSKRTMFDELMAEIASGRRRPDDIPDLKQALSLDEMLDALGLTRSTRSKKGGMQ